MLKERIVQKREMLGNVRERVRFLHQDNLMLRDRISNGEAAVFDRVGGMLNRCARLVGAKQMLNRNFRTSRQVRARCTHIVRP